MTESVKMQYEVYTLDKRCGIHQLRPYCEYAPESPTKFIANRRWMHWAGQPVFAFQCRDGWWRVFACDGLVLNTPSPTFETPEELIQWLRLVVDPT